MPDLMCTHRDEIVVAARDLARAGRWQRATALLDATTAPDAAGRALIAVAAAEVAVESDWFAGTADAAARIAAAEHAAAAAADLTATARWDLAFLRLRMAYHDLLMADSDPDGPSNRDPVRLADSDPDGPSNRDPVRLAGGDADGLAGGDVDGLAGGDAVRPGGGDAVRPGGGDAVRPAGGDPDRLAGGDPDRLAGGDPDRLAGGDPDRLAGGDADRLAELVGRAGDLRSQAPGEVRRGWAEFYLGVIADNLVGDRDSAPAHYAVALRAGESGDPLLAREALRHLGDHDHDRGDHRSALDRWRRATALGAGAGAVLGTLSQQMLLAVLARDTGDEAGAAALAGEIARWAGALGADRLAAQATAFLSGADPTRWPADDE